MQFKFRSLRLQDTPPSPQEVTKVIEEFQESWIKYHEINENKQLHHFTSLDAMRKIISERKFWFSHASSLNDPLETKYGRKVILDGFKRTRLGFETLILTTSSPLKRWIVRA